MKHRMLVSFAFLSSLLTLPFNASALTLEQFSALCESGPGACHEHPLAQAYVGGALDFVAVLDEQTEYLGPLYCESPKELFDMPAIIGFMLEQREAYADKNAMLLVVAYLEDNGRCPETDKSETD